MPDGAASRVYVVATSSLSAVADLGSRAGAVITGLVSLAAASRLCTVSLVWDALEDAAIRAALEPHRQAFVVKELDVHAELSQVLRVCGEQLLGNDPTLLDDPEPWLVALALSRNGVVVSEPSALSRLPTACATLGISLQNLADVVAAEGL